ncbi:alpha/beta fold hydrolase [Planomonospora corallina]|uniref:Alpha/beta fold hydrolase n=1 Tax=Planomonospora corallina TaxID=1806052 RepID=A0ABV8HZ82_9ACTN
MSVKRSFILLPGLWTGAWAWVGVAQRLKRFGHDARTITLSGLDDADADVSGIGLETHVDEVLSVIEKSDLHDAYVVAHSYSGIVAGIVADRMPERVAHTVFVEAFLPHDGRSLLDSFPDRVRDYELRTIEQNDGRWPPPDVTVVAEGQDLSRQQAEFLRTQMIAHPGRTVSEPALMSRPVSKLRGTYVVCEKDHFDGRVAPEIEALRAEPSWGFRTLTTGQWPMFSNPDGLSRLLSDVAAADV